MNTTTIEIKDLACYAYHGVLAEEARLGQRFKLDLRLKLVDGLSFASIPPKRQSIMRKWSKWCTSASPVPATT